MRVYCWQKEISRGGNSSPCLYLNNFKEILLNYYPTKPSMSSNKCCKVSFKHWKKSALGNFTYAPEFHPNCSFTSASNQWKSTIVFICLDLPATSSFHSVNINILLLSTIKGCITCVWVLYLDNKEQKWDIFRKK